jgi:hypothetical protein
MIADTIARIDHCPPCGERELMARILAETFGPVLATDADWPERMAAGLSDAEVKQYLNGLRDRLAQSLFCKPEARDEC